MKITIIKREPDHYFINKIETLKVNYKHAEFELLETNDGQNFSDSDIVISGRFTLDNLRTAPKLKALFVPYTGLNNFPLKELKDKNVRVCNSHGKAPIIAERALALTMATLGRIVEMHNLMKDEGIWLTRKNQDEFWNSLFNKRCAILGMGNIGQNIIKLLKPFNCKIIGLDRDKEKNLADETVPNLEHLVNNSDVLFVCLPLINETKGIIDKKILSNMHDKFIINVARGAIIDEHALYWALENNTLAGVGMDVWYNYPKPPYSQETYPSQYPIHKFNNVVMSPHAATHAGQTKYDYYDDIFNQLEYYLENNQFKSAVNIDKYIVDFK